MQRLKGLNKIEVPSPSDQIIQQLRGLIAQGVILAGDRLPSERALAEQFGVGRSVVREALLKLEFFGILKTRPQSGTTVEDMTSAGLSALISNMLSLADPKPSDMVEARRILEVQTARLAAERADRAAVAAIRAAHESHVASVASGEVSIESDVLFHLQIAEASGNDVLHSMVSVFAPRIISSAKQSRTCEDGRADNAVEEHASILRAIERADPEAAGHAMYRHLIMTGTRYSELDTER